MRIPFFAIAALSCIGMACAATDVDDLFDPSPTSGGAAGKGGSSQTGGSGGSSTGGTGGSTGGTGGGVTGGTGGTGGTATGGTGGVGGTGGTVTGGAGGTTGGTGGTGGAGGTAGTSVDAGVDVRRDAAADVRDAGKSGIRCGTTTCDSATQFCCLANNNIRCLGSASTMCTSSTDRLHCDDTTDCAVGQVCCVTEGIGGNGADAVCIAATLGCAAPKQMLCDPAVTAPCLNLANLVCSANGSGILQDYAYCHVP